MQRMWNSPVLDRARSSRWATPTSTALLAAIGENHVAARTVAQKVARTYRSSEEGDQVSASVLNLRGPRRNRNHAGVHVEGLDDVLVRLSKCCTPVPGDEIIGFVTRGRGVSVHRADCANAESLKTGQEARLIDVEWDGEQARRAVPCRRRGRRPRPLTPAARRRQLAVASSTSTSSPARRTPAPTESPRCGDMMEAMQLHRKDLSGKI